MGVSTREASSGLYLRMLRVTYHPAFLLVAAMVSAHVEPPTNVTFHCHNLSNVLKWSYGEMLPGLKFRVDIYPYYTPDSDEEISETKPKWVEPPTLQVDLSKLSNPNFSYLGFPNDYTVYVTALVGSNKSNSTPQQGISFSYYQNSLTHHKCFLDFPPVNISAEEDHSVRIHFVHPWFLYGSRLMDLSTSKHVPKFTYTVELVGQNTTKGKTCVSHSCSAKLQLHTPQETHCVKVNGEMDKMSVRGKHKYCMPPMVTPKETTKDYNVVAIAIAMAIVIALFGLAIVFFIVYKKKTRASTHLPQTLTFPERLKQLTLGLTPEHVSVPRVDPSSPTRLLEEGSDRPESIVLTPDPADLDIRLTIGLPSEGERAGEEEEAEDVEGLSPDYLTGRELEDEEEDEAPSCNGSTAGYEKRINATVQLAQDETLQGYRWRSSGENE